MHKFMVPKLIFPAGTNKVCDSISGGALGLLANLKKTCEVKGACQVEATRDNYLNEWK